MALANILIVEDDPACARLVQHLIGRCSGLSAELAYTLQEAQEKLRRRNNCIDLVLLDLGLPDALEGLGAVRQIKAETEVPIVVLTGRSLDEAFLKEAEQLGVCQVLQKESETLRQDLVDKIVDCIASHMPRALAKSQIGVAKEMRHLSLRYALEIIACMASLSLIAMSSTAFFFDLYEQVHKHGDYHPPQWIAVVAIPAVAAIVYWLYARRQN